MNSDTVVYVLWRNVIKMSKCPDLLEVEWERDKDQKSENIFSKEASIYYLFSPGCWFSLK